MSPWDASSGHVRLFPQGNTATIQFPQEVTFVGAWLAGRAVDQYFEGYKNGVKLFQSPHMANDFSTFGQFFTLNWTGVDEIRFQAASESKTAFDDLQYNICVPPPSGMIGWWPGDGNAADVIGGNNGTLQGAVAFAPGMVGQAFSFDGSSYVDASDSNLPVGNSSATISAWIKTTQTGEPFFVSWGSRSYGCFPGNEIALGNYNNHLILENCGGARQGASIVNDGAWHHVVGVWYGSNNATLYVDGLQQTDIHPILSRRLISSHRVI